MRLLPDGNLKDAKNRVVDFRTYVLSVFRRAGGAPHYNPGYNISKFFLKFEIFFLFFEIFFLFFEIFF